MEEFIEHVCKTRCNYYRKTTQGCSQTSWDYCIPRLVYEDYKEKHDVLLKGDEK